MRVFCDIFCIFSESQVSFAIGPFLAMPVSRFRHHSLQKQKRYRPSEAESGRRANDPRDDDVSRAAAAADENDEEEDAGGSSMGMCFSQVTLKISQYRFCFNRGLDFSLQIVHVRQQSCRWPRLLLKLFCLKGIRNDCSYSDVAHLYLAN